MEEKDCVIFNKIHYLGKPATQLVFTDTEEGYQRLFETLIDDADKEKRIIENPFKLLILIKAGRINEASEQISWGNISKVPIVGKENEEKVIVYLKFQDDTQAFEPFPEVIYANTLNGREKLFNKTIENISLEDVYLSGNKNKLKKNLLEGDFEEANKEIMLGSFDKLILDKEI